MFLGKNKLPADWPDLHHKCNRSKCTYPNHPQPAPGSYKCRGCEKGTYSVSHAQARAADARGRRAFYVPAQPWDLNQEFPPFIRRDTPKRNPTSPAQTAQEMKVQARAAKPPQVPSVPAHDHDLYHGPGSSNRNPHHANAFGQPDVGQQMYSSSSQYKNSPMVSLRRPGADLDYNGQEKVRGGGATSTTSTTSRKYRVVNV